MTKQANRKKKISTVSLEKSTSSARRLPLFLTLTALAIVTFITFYPSLKCEFTNWDDGTYITENPMIWKLDWNSLKEIFSTPVSLNYHPLTMLSLALDYKLGKLNPYYYHLNNVLIHILNTLLVFVFVYKFVRGYNQRASQQTFRPNPSFHPSTIPFNVALIVAVFFGIHPMRVESVTWVAERKDVLYVFFFLLSLIAYISPDRKGNKGKIRVQVPNSKFQVSSNSQKRKWNGCFLGTWDLALVTWLFFVCSCLSKGMAVVLPVILVLIDWFYGDAKTFKQIFQSIIRKWHFFVVSLIFGIAAFEIQSHGAIAPMETFTLFQRLTFATYGFIMYIYKLFLPVNLSAFYPYPFTDAQGNIPTIYYVSPFIVLLIALLIFFIMKKNKELGKILVFGFAFYFITVALVLQFISVGSVIMADRYSYLSYTGLFFILGSFFEYLRIKFPKIVSAFFLCILIVAAAAFSYLTHERTKVWTNAETLWTDAMNQFPFIEIAYENRGVFYKDKYEKTGSPKYLDLMLKDYVFVTEKLHSKNEKIWSNLGNLYGLRKQFDKSLDAYSHAIEINPKNASTYLNRAITLSMMGKYQEALVDYDKSLELAPNVALTYKNRAYTFLQLGQFDKAISDYNKAMELYPYDTLSYFNRGVAEFNAKKYEDALKDFSKYVSLHTHHPQTAQAYYNASLAAKELNKISDALVYAQQAQRLGYQLPLQYMEQLKTKQK
jgi:lipoprotein NlpI